MGKFGTLSALEDLAVDNDPISNRAEQIAQRFAAALAAYNVLARDMLDDLAGTTDQAQLAFPGADEAIIQELDEWGAADASKGTTTGEVGFPLRIYGGTLQWTNAYLKRATPAMLAAQLDALATADIKNIRRLLATVFFKPTNTVGYVDRLATKRSYDLKALLNADGQAIPPSPSGATFDGATHTHYLANATLTAVYLQGLIDTVVEHGVDGNVKVYIARADEATVRALTGFSAYLDTRVTVIGAAQVGNAALDVANPDNRAIGVFGGAEVWVKPWIPANYQTVLQTGGGVKPLMTRTRSGDFSAEGGLSLGAEHTHEPLHAEYYGREFGIGVYGRQRAAAGRSNNVTYAAPVLSY
jgi:hypothetical protein